jgi:hypothetical protein
VSCSAFGPHLSSNEVVIHESLVNGQPALPRDSPMPAGKV